jgi:hypothetical protein
MNWVRTMERGTSSRPVPSPDEKAGAAACGLVGDGWALPDNATRAHWGRAYGKF